MGAVAAFGAAAEKPELVKGIYSEDALPLLADQTYQDDAEIGKWLVQVGARVAAAQAKGESIAQLATSIGNLSVRGMKAFEFMDPLTLQFVARFCANTDPHFYGALAEPALFAWTEVEVA